MVSTPCCASKTDACQRAHCVIFHRRQHFFKTRHLRLQKWSEHGVSWTFWLRNLLRATTACTFSKLDISDSKSGPNMLCFVHFDLEMCFAPQRRALFQHPNLQKWREHVVLCTFWLGNVLRATTACTFSTSQLPKVVRPWCALYILTSKCASRHNGVHFFDISTSKSAPRMVCFVHFHFEMYFAPQRRALFRHRNFQKCSENGVFCAFSLWYVLRATTACTFSTSQLPKVVRSSSVLSILTWKCASRHNGVHFFMSHLASWLRTRRFSEPTFRPSGATNHWKKTVNRDFPIFSRIYLFFLLIFSLLSASSLLCVSTVHIVGSLASKLPSIIYIYIDHISSYIPLQTIVVVISWEPPIDLGVVKPAAEGKEQGEVGATDLGVETKR